jgi:hypothetical protein
VSDDTPITIHFVGAPVQLMQGLRLHMEAITREFQLIGFTGAEESSPPARLLALTSRLQHAYGRFDFATSRQGLSDALDRGIDTVDLELVVPASAGTAARAFLRSMDETDEWCERGDLLTLASPPEQRALRSWFFGEIERQVDGAPPRPWNDHDDASR